MFQWSPKVNYELNWKMAQIYWLRRSSFVDHLAICEKGVWDKGGDASGIRIDSETVGEPIEKVITAKLDVGQELEPEAQLLGANVPPTENMASIPPGINDLASGMSQLADRVAKFMSRRDLMVR